MVESFILTETLISTLDTGGPHGITELQPDTDSRWTASGSKNLWPICGQNSQHIAVRRCQRMGSLLAVHGERSLQGVRWRGRRLSGRNRVECIPRPPRAH
jgi:hypothetical protein